MSKGRGPQCHRYVASEWSVSERRRHGPSKSPRRCLPRSKGRRLSKAPQQSRNEIRERTCRVRSSTMLEGPRGRGREKQRQRHTAPARQRFEELSRLTLPLHTLQSDVLTLRHVAGGAFVSSIGRLSTRKRRVPSRCAGFSASKIYNSRSRVAKITQIANSGDTRTDYIDAA